MSIESVQRYARNEHGRDWAVGDVHGCFSKLESALAAISFDTSRDRLFSVGDLVDRGPESDRVLEWLERPWFHPVRGNHEDMAIRWPAGNMDAANYAKNGGSWNLANPRNVQQEISDALGALPIAIEVETADGLIGIVHADCPLPAWRDFVVSINDANVPNKIRKGIFETALWSRERIKDEDQSGIPDVRAVIVGHTPVKRPVVLGNVYHIDTGGWLLDGNFTFLELAPLETVPASHQQLEWHNE